MAKLPLMPKATAAWLVENTTLTFDQIAAFCGLHILEVQAIADDDLGAITPLSPITNGQLTRDEIKRCEADPAARLDIIVSDLPEPVARPKGARYTPVSKRQDKPDAIAWIVKNYPEVTDAQIGRLIGTTKQTITAVRERTHWNSPNIAPRSPVELGLCSMDELEGAILKARKKLENAKKRADREARRAAREAEAKETAPVEGAGAPALAPPPPAPAAPPPIQMPSSDSADDADPSEDA